MSDSNDPVAEFLVAACVPLERSHDSGTIDRAETIRMAHPDLASRDLYAAAALGDEVEVRQRIARDAAVATAKGGPHGWDALTYLCFSNYLKLDRARSDGFVRSARALLEAGASARAGFYEPSHKPNPVWESALYGAAGVAHHEGVTRVLLEHGADPNDDEVSYHTPEAYDNGALKAIVESGRVTADNLAAMLLRKADWHDHEGLKYLLEHGADPNRMTGWGYTPLHQALRRDNAYESIELLLDHGADPSIETRRERLSAVSIAVRRGRGRVLELFERRGLLPQLGGVERLIAACARDDVGEIQEIAAAEPDLVSALRADGGRLLAEFAGTANTAGVGHILDLGVGIGARYAGDGYFGIAHDSTALHVAAWRAWHETVQYLIGRGADVNAKDGAGQTPLVLAVKACVDSYWSERRAPDSVKALLDAGASPAGITVPTGYDEIDALLAAR
jgi:ankyrin repeat protein